MTSDAEILILGSSDIMSMLSVVDCIPLMEHALTELVRGEADAPVRLVLHAADGAGDIALMPAHMGHGDALGFKAVTVFPGAREYGEPSHQAAVALLDPGSGRLYALLDGTSITRIRTAAVTAVATRHLARPDASILAVLGSGVQAEAHLAAIPLVRDLSEIRIWARRPEEARRLAAVNHDRAPVVRAESDPRVATAGADLIVTATTATNPILAYDWLRPGCHVNAVGSCVPTAREIDAETIANARVFVEDRNSALVEAGDLLLAIRDGNVSADHIAGELGDVILGRLTGREHEDQITLFESLGVGVEDVAAAHHVYNRANREGRGERVSLA